ncbi:MAG TPA: reverse transcriptase domain-containing protein, partial [Nitrososphaeraceae archaeon]|nr:reverse transcriptase domain-containing protein [Nitrososphaeraceae archaeon]
MSDEHLIANRFAAYFTELLKSEKEKSLKFRNKFHDQLVNYIGDFRTNTALDIETIDTIIRKLKRGKAAGIDNLTVEHLQFCHPIVISAITGLFNLMITDNYVPDAFGQGIAVPIPKGDNQCSHDKSSDYRCITISPLLSKIFELALQENLASYLITSERQFGFKQKIGCNDAIFAVRKVVDYFSTNNSTVNICSLDLSKAFDRINHCALFSKLIQRNVPVCYIKLLKLWYDNNFISVKWGEYNSTFF